MADPDPFDQLLAAARTGAPWALERLYEDLAGRVLTFARSRRAPDPEGVVNEVFLRAFRSIDRFEGSEPQLRAWLFRIARNILIDESRRASRRPEAVPDTTGPELRGGDVEEDAMTSIGTGWLHDALQQLSAEQRDVLLLRIVADLTVEQVAEVVGKRPGAVKALQRRGLATLRRMVGGEGVPL